MNQNQDFVRHLGDDYGLYGGDNLSEKWHIDFMLLGCIILTCCMGLFILYSASGQDIDSVIRQAAYMLIGLVCMVAVAQIPLRVLSRVSPFFYMLAVFLLLIVLWMGSYSKGAQRWIQLPFIRFQPSELIKLVMPIVVSTYLSRRALPPSLQNATVVVIIIAFPALLVAKQPDLGTSLLVASSGLFALLLAGLRKRVVFAAAAVAIPSVWIFWMYMMLPYQKQRVLTFLNPESDPLGAGWNIIQSKIAIGSGGFYGKGWLFGTQSHLNFLPESHTDFIIAVLAEETGLLGCMVLLSFYAAIVARGMYIALTAPSQFGRLLAGSITLTFFVYIFVNIGMVTGLLPVVGVPLPLISRGGTSLVTLMVGFGILMSIHTNRNFLGRVQ